MSSLLEGIDVGESGGKQPRSSGGPSPKVIKGAVAGVLFLVAGVALAMQFGLISSPLGGGNVRNSSGQTVEYVPTNEAEVRPELERLERQNQGIIDRGGVEGGA